MDILHNDSIITVLI